LQNDELDLVAVGGGPAGEGRRLAEGERTRPLPPGAAVVGAPQREEEREVVEPVPVSPSEVFEVAHEVGALLLAVPVEGRAQQPVLPVLDRPVLHPLGREARRTVEPGRLHQPVLGQPPRADEQLVAGEGRQRRVRRAPGAGRMEGQHLPPADPGAGEPAQVGHGRWAEVAGSEAGWQRGRVEQDTGRANERGRHGPMVDDRGPLRPGPVPAVGRSAVLHSELGGACRCSHLFA
jgi:hypothetical protein